MRPGTKVVVIHTNFPSLDGRVGWVTRQTAPGGGYLIRMRKGPPVVMPAVCVRPAYTLRYLLRKVFS